MSTRIVIGAVVGVMMLGAATVAVGASSIERVAAPAAKTTDTYPRQLNNAERQLAQAKVARIKCKTVSCINKSLTKLAKAVNTLGHAVFDCEQVANVTQYNGYLYDPSGNGTGTPVTALDFTIEGDPVSAQFLVVGC